MPSMGIERWGGRRTLRQRQLQRSCGELSVICQGTEKPLCLEFGVHRCIGVTDHVDCGPGRSYKGPAMAERRRKTTLGLDLGLSM